MKSEVPDHCCWWYYPWTGGPGWYNKVYLATMFLPWVPSLDYLNWLWPNIPFLSQVDFCLGFITAIETRLQQFTYIDRIDILFFWKIFFSNELFVNWPHFLIRSQLFTGIVTSFLFCYYWLVHYDYWIDVYRHLIMFTESHKKEF